MLMTKNSHSGRREWSRSFRSAGIWERQFGSLLAATIKSSAFQLCATKQNQNAHFRPRRSFILQNYLVYECSVFGQAALVNLSGGRTSIS